MIRILAIAMASYLLLYNPAYASAAACSDLGSVRAMVWKSWFAGNTTALRALLSPNVIAIDAPGQWHTLNDVLSDAQAFSRHGRLLSLSFPLVKVQRYGDVAVMYSKYRVHSEYDGHSITESGSASEVFQLRNGCWINTGWHLDASER
jgi:Domain of unknown function (DUF4440)